MIRDYDDRAAPRNAVVDFQRVGCHRVR